MICVSIVNHGHCMMIPNLLLQLSSLNKSIGHVILTNNIKTSLKLDPSIYSFELTIIDNPSPIGFGANHNQAFAIADKPYFCVLNPDVIFHIDPFQKILLCFEDESIGVVAPISINKSGIFEDSFRNFPTPFSLFKKFLFKSKDFYKSSLDEDIIFPDWCAGMFLMFKKEIYESLNGFDESYFLYYEDIDICLRIWQSGKKVAVTKAAQIEHSGQRDSHKNLTHLKMHLVSIFIFFYKHLFRFPR